MGISTIDSAAIGFINTCAVMLFGWVLSKFIQKN